GRVSFAHPQKLLAFRVFAQPLTRKWWSMNDDYWSLLHKRLLVLGCPPHKVPLPKPTDELLAEFEQGRSFKLPAGYIAFLRIFGPGELVRVYRLRAPGYPDEGDTVDLGTF